MNAITPLDLANLLHSRGIDLQVNLLAGILCEVLADVEEINLPQRPQMVEVVRLPPPRVWFTHDGVYPKGSPSEAVWLHVRSADGEYLVSRRVELENGVMPELATLLRSLPESFPPPQETDSEREKRWIEGAPPGNLSIADARLIAGVQGGNRPEVLAPPKSTTGKQVGGDHYQMPIQHFDFVTVNDIPYGEATAIKYLVRHWKKNKHEDLDKAIHYILMVRAKRYPDAPKWVDPMK